MNISVPRWLLGYSEGHGCGMSQKVNPDGTVDVIDGPVILQKSATTVTVAADQLSASWTCPNPDCPDPEIVIRKPAPATEL